MWLTMSILSEEGCGLGFASNLVFFIFFWFYYSWLSVGGCGVLRLIVGCNSFSDSCFLLVVGRRNVFCWRQTGGCRCRGWCWFLVFNCRPVSVLVVDCLCRLRTVFPFVAAHLCLLCRHFLPRELAHSSSDSQSLGKEVMTTGKKFSVSASWSFFPATNCH